MSTAEQLPLVTSITETLDDWDKLATKQKMGAIAALTITVSRPILRALHEAEKGDDTRVNTSDLIKDICLDFSDKADGITARSTDGVTPLGKELDPLMDKIDFAIQEVAQNRRGQLPLGHIAVRLARDIVVTLVRSHVNAATNGNVNIGAGWHGKASTGARLASLRATGLPIERDNLRLRRAHQSLATGAILASGAKNIIDLMGAKKKYLDTQSETS
jgi:phosphatidylglycerophosphate synthase